MSTPGCGQITRSTPTPQLPGLIPPVGDGSGTGTHVSEVENSCGEQSVDVNIFVNEFLSSLPTYYDGEDSDVLAKDGRHDTTDTTPTLRRSLFYDGIKEMPPTASVATNEAVAALAHLMTIPSNYGTVENCFTNQVPELNYEGYDSEGNLPHFANPDTEDNEELYNEECIGGRGGVEMVVAPAAAPAAIDVMKLSVVLLRAELKKRGRVLLVIRQPCNST
jgi:hypothetical protein